jgi:hypothetical protein
MPFNIWSNKKNKMKSKFKKSVAAIIVASTLTLFLTGCCKPEIIGNVPNTLRPQETNNWCWAATTQMLAKHFDINVNQCDLANHRFGKSNCCTPQNTNSSCPKTVDCNQAGNLELDYVGLKFSVSTTALSFEDLKKQIFCAKKPMAYAYGGTGIGHVLVIKGYITVNGTNYLVLNDPWSPCVGSERTITYEEYADPTGSVTHWDTYYDLTKK